MDIRTIRAGGYTVMINLTRGANCISIRHEKSRAVILREPSYERELDNPYLYGMPMLLPVNRISGGEFEYEGRTYRFPINEERTGCHLHGTLHAMPFKAVSVTDSSLTASYTAECGEYLDFPHAFRVEIKYEINEDGVKVITEVENLSDSNMPCLLGFHTTFNSLPFKDEKHSKVLVDIEKEYERNMENYLPTGKCPEPDAVTAALKKGSFNPLSEPISRHYRAGGDMRLSIVSEHHTLVYENSENMPFRLIYNGDAKGYICLEPQTSLANSPNSPFTRDEAGFKTIPPHSSELFISKFKVINNNVYKGENQ